MLILKGVMAAILVSLPVLILSDLHAYSRFEESEFVARKGAEASALGCNAAGPNESTVAGEQHPLTCPLNPTPIGRFIPLNPRDGEELAFPAGDRESKKGGKEAAATGGNPHFYPQTSVPNGT